MAASGRAKVLEVSRSSFGYWVLLAPDGALCGAGAAAPLAAELETCIAGNDWHVLVDFTRVPLIDSAALEVLLDACRRLLRLGGGLRARNLNQLLREVFRITGVDRAIDCETPPAGDAAVQATPAGRGFRLGARLLELGLASEAAVEEAVQRQQREGGKLGAILVDSGAVREADLLPVLAEQLDLPWVQLRSGLYDPAVVPLLPEELARRLQVLPLFRIHGDLFLATAGPQDIAAFDVVEEHSGCRVQPVLASRDDIHKCAAEARSAGGNLSEFIGQLDVDDDLQLVESQSADYTAIDELAAGSPVINLINGLVQRAVRDGASDIHIEPGRNQCHVRFRIDGLLYPVMSPPQDMFPALVSRLKVMASLDIAERRLPQDGRIQVFTQGRVIDLRFSSLPGIYGEKVVLRVLDKSQTVMEVERLGLSGDHLAQFTGLLHRAHGLLLVTGPTGSGKTTTLYAAINHLSSVEKSIVTIEDPVEYQLDTINQNQVRDNIGLGFARLLKHVLRQDPDIIMVGEIRERETAEIAVQAALTGHLVLSTLHTNDSIGAITRLLDMGIQPYLLSSALIGVVSQRLVRTICPHCKVSYMAPAVTLERRGVSTQDNVRMYRGKGCNHCYDSGYKGRLAIHELFEVDDSTQRLMVVNPSRDQLTAHLREREVPSLYDAGVTRALAGDTTLEEIMRVTRC